MRKKIQLRDLKKEKEERKIKIIPQKLISHYKEISQNQITISYMQIYSKRD